MTRQIGRHHLHKLRKGRRDSAGQPKSLVPLTDLKTALKITNNEWRSLYLLFREEGLGDTDGMSANISLTQHGRAEAEKLDR